MCLKRRCGWALVHLCYWWLGIGRIAGSPVVTLPGKTVVPSPDKQPLPIPLQERVRNAKQAAEAQDMKRKHMQAFIDRFRYNANRAALVQSRIKALERLAGALDGWAWRTRSCTEAAHLKRAWVLPLPGSTCCSPTTHVPPCRRGGDG